MSIQNPSIFCPETRPSAMAWRNKGPSLQGPAGYVVKQFGTIQSDAAECELFGIV